MAPRGESRDTGRPLTGREGCSFLVALAYCGSLAFGVRLRRCTPLLQREQKTGGAALRIALWALHAAHARQETCSSWVVALLYWCLQIAAGVLSFVGAAPLLVQATFRVLAGFALPGAHLRFLAKLAARLMARRLLGRLSEALRFL